MRHMNTKILWAAGLVSMIAAIACSGGSVDLPTRPSSSGTSGRATTIRGTTRGSNAAVASASQFAIQAATTIRICVSGTATCAAVDGTGNFVLTGNFSGDVHLQVTSPQGTVMLTLPNVKHGETIVVIVSFNGPNGVMQIVSRTGGDDDDEDNDDEDDDEDDDEGEVELRGTVSGLSRGCPTPSFLLSGRAIVTNNSTRFEGGCPALQNGRRVEVSGVMQTNGTVLATEVEIDD